MFEKQKNFSRKIGEVFTFFRGNASAPFPIDLKVTEVAEPKCIGCYFYRPDKKSDNNPNGCTKIIAYAGDCDAKMRTDKKNVIFVTEKIG